jgi:hypothetical protein
VFKEIGLTQEQASKIVVAYAEHLKDAGGDAIDAALDARLQQQVAARIEADSAALKADPEIGGANFDRVNADVKDFIATQGTAEFRAFVDSLGIGNSPEFIRAIHRAIHYRPVDRGATPADGGGAPKSPAHALFPGLK